MNDLTRDILYSQYQNEELYHHGILGMHWGVRRFQPYPSDYKGNGVEIGDAKKRPKRRITEYDDIVIKKGTKMYRLTRDKDDKTSSKYLTVDPGDRAHYKWSWTDAMRGVTGMATKDQVIYENTYRNKEDLRSPSMIKRRDLAASLVKDDKTRDIIKSEIAINRTVDRYREQNPDLKINAARNIVKVAALPDKQYNDLLKSASPGFKSTFDALRNTYKAYVKSYDTIFEKNKDDNLELATYVLSNMGGSDVIKVEYGKKVMEAGYNMSIDDHGADFKKEYGQVNAPIIVYMSNDLLKQVGSKPVSELDSEIALDKVRDIASSNLRQMYKYHIPNVIKTSYGLERYYGDQITK